MLSEDVSFCQDVVQVRRVQDLQNLREGVQDLKEAVQNQEEAVQDLHLLDQLRRGSRG